MRLLIVGVIMYYYQKNINRQLEQMVLSCLNQII